MGNLAEVKIKEIDLSLVSNPSTGNVLALFIGSAERGKPNVMTLITDNIYLQKKFGGINENYDTFEANLYLSYANSPIYFIRSVSPILEKPVPHVFKKSNGTDNTNIILNWTEFINTDNGYYFSNIHKQLITFVFYNKNDISDTTDTSGNIIHTIGAKFIIFDKELYNSLYNSIPSIQKAMLNNNELHNEYYLEITKTLLNSYERGIGFWSIPLTITFVDTTDNTADVTFNFSNNYSYFNINDYTLTDVDNTAVYQTIWNELYTTFYFKQSNLVEQLFKKGHLLKKDGTIISDAPDIDVTTNILDITDWSVYLTDVSDLSQMPITQTIFDNTQNISNENYVIDFIITPSVYINITTLEIFAPISTVIEQKPTMTYLFGIASDETEDITTIIQKVQNVPGFPSDKIVSYYATLYPNIYYNNRKINGATALAIMYARKGADNFYQPAANTRWGSIIFATGVERILFRNEADMLYTNANINPILSKNGNPAVIWGNRTLYLAGTGTSSARSMLSLRLALNRYKIELQNLLSQYLFVVGDFNLIFNDMAVNIDNISNRYIGKAFRSVKTKNITTDDEETNHIMHIQIEITPNYSVEKIYLDIVITNAGITITE